VQKKKFEEEVKKSDIFIQITDMAIHWIEKHWRSVGTFLLFCAILGAGYVGYNIKSANDENKANANLYQIRLESEKFDKTFNKESGAAFDSHFSTVIKSYNDFFANFRKTKIESAGHLQLADFYLKYEQNEKAEEILNKAVNALKKTDFYYGFVSMKLSQVLINNQKYSEAIKVLENVSGLPEHSHIHAESLLRVGQCYEKLQDLEKAKQYFERVNRDFSNTESAKNAKLYLRYLALKG
jgi:predicted negative regulator of RcsB-dependent stress response